MRRCRRSRTGTCLIRLMSFRYTISLVAALLVAISASASDLAILQNGFSIRHEGRETLGGITRLYTTANRTSYIDVPTEQIEHFEADLTIAPKPQTPPARPPARDLKDVIQSASDKQLLDVDLINSVIRAESGFNPRALSPKGARGLMQLMPETATTLGVADAFDPQANVEGGTRYLRWLLDHYNYDLAKALAAYNARPHRVKQYRGIPPYAETRAYVAKIIRDFNRQKLAERKAASGKPAQKGSEPKQGGPRLSAAAGAGN